MQKLDCVVQKYAWGDPNSIPELLGTAPTGGPQAELWMGAHPKAPSLVDGQPLNELITDNPVGLLGPDVADRFGQLPYLFKVLAAGQPLSIQAHPSLEQARAGYARENEAGIDIGAASRTYRDANHKPELICALTPFVAKCGFRSLAQTRALFDGLSHPKIEPLREKLAVDGPDGEVLATVLAWLLRLDPARTTELVQAVVAAAALGSNTRFAADLEWTSTINDYFPDDIGVVVALLLNHVVLEPGDAVFLDAGNLHVYLRGTGIELMANSDNVVRGGLTPKHIDVEELLVVVDCSPIDPPIQRSSSQVHRFAAPVPEFSLTRLVLDGKAEPAVEPTSAEIVIATEGKTTLSTADDTLSLAAGEVAFIGANDGPYKVSGRGTVFRAAVG